MPVVDEGEQEILDSKIGGKAYIPAGEKHPQCPNCNKELTLFLQLNPKDFPENSDLDPEPDKLIQLFYCTSHCFILAKIPIEYFWEAEKFIFQPHIRTPD